MAIASLALRRSLISSRNSRSLSSSLSLRALDDDPEGKGPWNYIWKPAPYPKTEEERRKAAIKYGMIPEDYVPIKDDGDGVGDYPDLGKSSMESRSGYIAWDMPSLKRNYGEPMNIDFLHTMDYWGYDDTTPDPRSQLYKVSVFLAYVVTIIVLMNSFKEYQICVPMAEKQLISSKETHYTFEPLD